MVIAYGIISIIFVFLIYYLYYQKTECEFKIKSIKLIQLHYFV